MMYDFGIVDDYSDGFEFTIRDAGEGDCRLVAVVQTERGPRRTDVAAVPAELWRSIAAAATKELVTAMGEGERGRKTPTFKPGTNRMGSLVGRELGVLLMVLMEEGAADRTDVLLHTWRELAREERWWLYGKAAAPGQRIGTGWRRALWHALGETADTRTAPFKEEKKKSPSKQEKRSSRKPRANIPSST